MKYKIANNFKVAKNDGQFKLIFECFKSKIKYTCELYNIIDAKFIIRKTKPPFIAFNINGGVVENLNDNYISEMRQHGFIKG